MNRIEIGAVTGWAEASATTRWFARSVFLRHILLLLLLLGGSIPFARASCLGDGVTCFPDFFANSRAQALADCQVALANFHGFGFPSCDSPGIQPPNNIMLIGHSDFFANNFVAAYWYPPSATCPSGQQFAGPPPGSCQFIGPTVADLQKEKMLAGTCNGEAETGLVSNPCNAANGNKYQSETDFQASEGIASFTRSYNSQLSQDIGLGFGWAASARKRIEVNGTLVQIRTGSGKGEPFTCPSGTGACTGDADTIVNLTKDTTGYTLTRRDNATERYNSAGALLSEIDTNNRTTTYAYNGSGQLIAATGPFGHTVGFTYSGNHISSVTDPSGAVYSYTYDSNSNLTRVSYPDGSTKLYHYENSTFPHHLTGISYQDAGGSAVRYSTYSYDTNGKAVVTEHAGGIEHFGLSYDSDTQTTVTDAANTQSVMTFSANLGIKNLIARANQSDGKALNQAFDAQNNLTCKKDEEGRVVTYTYNGANQKTAMTEGLIGSCASPITTSATRTTSYQYVSSTLNLPTVIQSPSVFNGGNKTVTIAYGDTSHPSLPTAITQSGFTSSGSAVSRAVTLSYTASGQVASINGPRSDVNDITTLSYNDCTSGSGCGQLRSITNAAGHLTTFDSYDAAGRLLQTTDPNGLRSNYTYDGRGRVISVIQTPAGGSARTTQYAYNAANNVTQVIQPDGITLTYIYDAAQKLRQVTDNLGNRINYNYDSRGNRTEALTRDPDGTLVRSIQTAYDIRNHTAAINDGGAVTQALNDALGNLTRVTDPNQVAVASGISTNHTHDALNRLIQTVNNLSGVTTYNYDSGDRLTGVQAPNNATTQYQYDDLGDLLQETSPDRGTTVYTYDAAGNVVQMTDARGVIVSYAYDALNRLTLINYPGTDEDVSFAYDSGCAAGIGRLCALQDQSGTTTYAYDAFGNRLQQVHTELGIAYTTSYTYDNANRVLAIAYPSGRLATYARDAIGRIGATNATLNGTNTAIVANRAYHADGLLRAQTFGNGFSDTRSYDLQGRLLAQTVPRVAAATPAVSGVVLAPNKSSPQVAGTAITFTAQASGGSGTYQYRFTLNGPGTNNLPSVVQNYGSANTFLWNTTAADLGSTTVTVEAKNAGLASGAVASVSTSFTINAAAPPANAPIVTSFGTLSAPQQSERRFTVDVPAGAANLTVTLRGGTGDADLYVKYGAPPTTTDNDCASNQGGANGASDETCVLIATPGTWHILVVAFSDIANVSVEARYTMSNLLTNGAPVTGLTAAAGGRWLYAIDVPANSANLKVSLSGGSGDADLYLRYGVVPTTTANDCYSNQGGVNGQSANGQSDETCVVTATPGRWYILIDAFSDIDNITLTASYTTSDAALLQNGVPVGGLSASAFSQFRYAIDVPSGASNLRFTTIGGSGDADLYVKYAAPPSTTDNDCASNQGGVNDQSEETCLITTATPGRWHILVFAYSNITNVTLTASYTTGSASASDSESAFTIDVAGASDSESTRVSDGESASVLGNANTSAALRPSVIPAEAGIQVLNNIRPSANARADRAPNITMPPARSLASANASSAIAASSQLIAVKSDIESDYQYWVRSEATQHQWLAVNDYTPYLNATPDVLARIDAGNVELWRRSETGAFGYDYVGGSEASAILFPVALSTNPNPAASDTKNYAYDSNGNLLGVQVPNVIDLYAYDALDRLIADQFGTLPPVQFGYDQNGNRTNQLFDGFSETSTYATNTNRLTQKGAQTLSYDPSGNLLNDGQGNTYTYNNAGRLSQVFSNGALVATYIYNFEGQRTRKVTSQGTTIYHYDMNGNLISETNANGTLIRDYVYADNVPIAQIDASTTTEDITYLHTDHLGTPRHGTDANRTVVWTWRSFGFGSGEPNGDADGDGVATTVNLRLPGQYFDQESGLVYGGGRYWDPKLGRSITADRMSVAAHVERGFEMMGTLNHPPVELSPYPYAASNPLRWTDPTGEVIPWRDPYDETELDWLTNSKGKCDGCYDYASSMHNNVIIPIQLGAMVFAASSPIIVGARYCPVPRIAPAICRNAALAAVLGLGICQGKPANSYTRHKETLDKIREATQNVPRRNSGGIPGK